MRQSSTNGCETDDVEGRDVLLATGTEVVNDHAEVESDIAVPDGFAVTDITTANWVVRKIVAARQYAEAVKGWAEREHRRAEREEQTLLFLFGRQIEAWTKAEITRLKGKRKSIPLPAGVVGFRKVNESLHVDDESIVLQWAKVHCKKAIVVVEKLSRTELKAHFEATGEVPEVGAHVEPEREQFYLR